MCHTLLWDISSVLGGPLAAMGDLSRLCLLTLLMHRAGPDFNEVFLVKQSLMFVSRVSEDTDVIIMNHNNEDRKNNLFVCFAHFTEKQQTALMHLTTFYFLVGIKDKHQTS